MYQNALADRQCLGTKLEPRLPAFITKLTALSDKGNEKGKQSNSFI